PGEGAVRAEATHPARGPAARRTRMGAPLAAAPLSQVAPVVAPAVRAVGNRPAPTEQLSAAPSKATSASSRASALPIVASRRASPPGAPGMAAPRTPLVASRPLPTPPGRPPLAMPRQSPGPPAAPPPAHARPAPPPAP